MPFPPALAVLALYAGLLGLVHFWLMAHVGRTRTATKVWIGDGDDPRMVRAMRGEANFVEQVPMALIMLLVAALIGAPAWLVHAFGVAIVLARVLHGLYFTRAAAPLILRQAGAGLSILVLLVLSVGLAGHGLYLVLS